MIHTQSITSEITFLIEDWQPRLTALPDEIITRRRNSQNRTIKQILGHTIDSTSNNIHRIVHLQYQQSPLTFPNYASFGNNDRWIAIQDYQNENWMNMIQLWKHSLLHLCHVMRNVDETKLSNEWIAGPDKTLTLEEVINGFTGHLRLHLSEINDLISSKTEQSDGTGNKGK
jgi:DinB superfamily